MIKLAIINYPQSLKSAVFGIAEQFAMANAIADELQLQKYVITEVVDFTSDDAAQHQARTRHYDFLVIPPASSKTATMITAPGLADWLQMQFKQDAVVSAACVGVFLLAQSGLLDHKVATSHWGLKDELDELFPKVKLQTNETVIDLGQIITAGGMMSWVDLNLRLVMRIFGPKVMSLLGKQLLVDVGDKLQQYYQRFIPNKTHQDRMVLLAQEYIENQFTNEIRIPDICATVNLTERTLQRKFNDILGMSPLTYIQRTRVQFACEQLELSALPIDNIAFQCGYADINGFRKVFIKTMGLTPSEFRKKFRLTNS